MTAVLRTRHDVEAPVIDFGADVCADLAQSERREWLATNGLGGYASGTIAGVLTRRYHGWLVAALRPPVARTLLVSKFDESVDYDGVHYRLGANRWQDGTIEPRGFSYIERFRLEGSLPVWTFALGDALLERRIWMEQGADTTYVSYRVARARVPVRLDVAAFVNYRDHHATTQAGDWRMDVSHVDGGLRVRAYEGAMPVYLLSEGALAYRAHQWHRAYLLGAETARGLDDCEDHLHAANFVREMVAGETLLLVLSTDPEALIDAGLAAERRRAHEQSLLDWWRAAGPAQMRVDPPWIRQLALAADQFIVTRPREDDPDARTIVAGYHWFGDWGRDTMIALPGLTLATNRPHIARKILRTFGGYVDAGMLPNFFPEAGEAPQYNTVDAALWYFEAVLRYYEATQDERLVADLFPVLAGIIDAYVAGTRYNIHVDPEDGLVYAGEVGVALTWMDARAGDWVVTPRIGKPVEIAALWLNALHAMMGFAEVLGRNGARYEALAEMTRRNFKRFWNPQTNCCFDVLDGPQGDDPAIRPNQLFAVALRQAPLAHDRQRAVLDACERLLLTPYGLRSLDPGSAAYAPAYAGSQTQRDGAYHQGTVWGWLIGPFIDAHLRVHRNKELALSHLAALAHHVGAHGLGSASEIFEGAAPFRPDGCIAQAWTVAEILRAWRRIAESA